MHSLEHVLLIDLRGDNKSAESENRTDNEEDNNNNVLCTFLDINTATTITTSAPVVEITTTETAIATTSRTNQLNDENMLTDTSPIEPLNSRLFQNLLNDDDSNLKVCSSNRPSIHYDSLHNQQSWKIICIRRNKVS